MFIKHPVMHQLLKPGVGKFTSGGMKWEHFLKVMREMGFEQDPISSTDSSVQFNPPNNNDVPMTIHKPYPDPILTPSVLHAICKKMKYKYGFTEDDLLQLGGSHASEP